MFASMSSMRGGSRSFIKNKWDPQLFDPLLLPIAALNLSSSAVLPLPSVATILPPSFLPSNCSLAPSASPLTVLPSSLSAMPCLRLLSFNKLSPSPPSASLCRCALAFAARIVTRVYTKSRQAIVKAAAGATIVRESKGRRRRV